MKRETAGRSAEPRRCALCGGPMMGSRPIVLVERPDHSLVGPYHFGCAERICVARSSGEMPGTPGATNYGTVVLPAREETLPW